MQTASLSWRVGSLSIASLVLFPLLTLLWISLGSGGDVWSHLIETVLADYVSTSLGLMLGVAAVTLLLGIGSAWLVTHYQFTGAEMLSWALLLPLAMPTYITAYSYTGLLDVAGPIQSGLRASFELDVGDYWFPSIRSLGGAIFVMSFVLYPYVYLMARAAFLAQSENLQNVGRLLGYSRPQAFLRITLPIARPAIIAGVSLALMETLADFGAVSYFGLSTFTTGIFRTWYGLDSIGGAAQLALMLLGFIVLLIALEKSSRKRASYQTNSTPQTRHKVTLNGSKNLGALMLAATPLLFGFVVPSGQLMVWAAQSHAQIFSADFWQLVLNTLGLAALTATLALSLALIVAYSHRVLPNLLTLVAKRVVGLGYAIPGTVIAVGTLIPLARLDNSIDQWFRSNFDISTGLLISGTITALVIAYLVRFLAVALGAVESGLSSIRPSMDQAARSLGYRPFDVMRKVHVPMLRSSLFTALLIVFVDVMKELPATLILRPFNFNTLAVRAYELASDERLADASLASISIVLVGLIPVILLTKASQR